VVIYHSLLFFACWVRRFVESAQGPTRRSSGTRPKAGEPLSSTLGNYALSAYLENLILKSFFVFILLMCSNWVAAETFPTVDAYVAHITNGQSGNISVQRSSGDSIFGAVQWSPTDSTQEAYFASVYILEKLKDNSFKEVIRSNPSGGFSGSATETIDGIETKTNHRFSVRLHSFKPLGTITYRFALIDEAWCLSGRDEEFLYFNPEDGDEAVGDSRVERSTNFLTGKIIEKNFRRDKLVSTKNIKAKFPKFPLSDFKLFDEKYGYH